MEENTQKLLTAVLKNFAEGKVNELNDCVSDDDFFGASEKANDLKEYYKMISELEDNAPSIEHLEEFETWLYVKDWTTEYDNWEEVIHNEAVENGLEGCEDAVADLFR